MKSPVPNRRHAASLARQRALIRSLIEQTASTQRPGHGTSGPEPGGAVAKMAPTESNIIPFPKLRQ